MILDLQEARIGDQGRLAHIMERIENGRTIYNSDEQYVRQKFRQLREEVTRESEDEPEQPDSSLDRVTSPPPDPEPPVSRKAGDDARPSKAWYVLPIFLGILGGVIAFAALRKRRRGMAYKTLGVGVGITMILPALVLGAYMAESGSVTDMFDSNPLASNRSADDSTSMPVPESASEQTEHRPATFLSTSDTFWTVDQSLSHAQIKRSAIHMPYDVLMRYEHDGETRSYHPPHSDECVFKGTDVCDRFVGNLVHHSGVLYGYHDHWGNDDTVVLSLGLTDNTCIESKEVHVIYVPSDEERRWLENEPKFLTECQQSERRINFWGTHVGFYGGEYTRPTPLISGHIVELVEPDRKVSFSGIVQRHTVSVDDMPSYVDVAVVDRGLRDAVQAWNNGGSVKFTMVKSDGDVNIGWNRGGAGLLLGHYGARVLDDGTKENHFIRVNLGGEDCHSDYQQFASDSLKHTIAHELGHYLGLRHAADQTHLMHGGGFTMGDSRSIYDSHGLVIPEIGRPDVATVKGQSVEFEIDSAYGELERLTHDPSAYNVLAAEIVNLETEIACQQAR